jgi:tRNA threonylcarbamoyladenosine biosynthesis protein TsaB
VRILGLDTSTRSGSVALLEEKTIVAEMQATSSETHAKRLMSAVDMILAMAGASVYECDGFAVTTGPGSFTGLRIGISVVKGLAFATGKPVTGMSTLEVLAYQFRWFPHPICPMLDARKGEVYTGLYTFSQDGTMTALASDCVVSPRSWVGGLQDPCLFVGDGATVYRGLIKEVLGSQAQFAPPFASTPRASVVAYVGLEQIERGEVVAVEDLVPRYIRKSDAEIKLEKASVDRKTVQI